MTKRESESKRESASAFDSERVKVKVRAKAKASVKDFLESEVPKRHQLSQNAEERLRASSTKRRCAKPDAKIA